MAGPFYAFDFRAAADGRSPFWLNLERGEFIAPLHDVDTPPGRSVSQPVRSPGGGAGEPRGRLRPPTPPWRPTWTPLAPVPSRFRSRLRLPLPSNWRWRYPSRSHDSCCSAAHLRRVRRRVELAKRPQRRTAVADFVYPPLSHSYLVSFVKVERTQGHLNRGTSMPVRASRRKRMGAPI
jgi:hypothetical protein